MATSSIQNPGAPLVDPNIAAQAAATAAAASSAAPPSSSASGSALSPLPVVGEGDSAPLLSQNGELDDLEIQTSGFRRFLNGFVTTASMELPGERETHIQSYHFFADRLENLRSDETNLTGVIPDRFEKTKKATKWASKIVLPLEAILRGIVAPIVKTVNSEAPDATAVRCYFTGKTRDGRVTPESRAKQNYLKGIFIATPHYVVVQSINIAASIAVMGVHALKAICSTILAPIAVGLVALEVIFPGIFGAAGATVGGAIATAAASVGSAFAAAGTAVGGAFVTAANAVAAAFVSLGASISGACVAGGAAIGVSATGFGAIVVAAAVGTALLVCASARLVRLCVESYRESRFEEMAANNAELLAVSGQLAALQEEGYTPERQAKLESLTKELDRLEGIWTQREKAKAKTLHTLNEKILPGYTAHVRGVLHGTSVSFHRDQWTSIESLKNFNALNDTNQPAYVAALRKMSAEDLYKAVEKYQPLKADGTPMTEAADIAQVRAMHLTRLLLQKEHQTPGSECDNSVAIHELAVNDAALLAMAPNYQQTLDGNIFNLEDRIASETQYLGELNDMIARKTGKNTRDQAALDAALDPDNQLARRTLTQKIVNRRTEITGFTAQVELTNQRIAACRTQIAAHQNAQIAALSYAFLTSTHFEAAVVAAQEAEEENAGFRLFLSENAERTALFTHEEGAQEFSPAQRQGQVAAHKAYQSKNWFAKQISTIQGNRKEKAALALAALPAVGAAVASGGASSTIPRVDLEQSSGAVGGDVPPRTGALRRIGARISGAAHNASDIVHRRRASNDNNQPVEGADDAGSLLSVEEREDAGDGAGMLMGAPAPRARFQGLRDMFTSMPSIPRFGRAASTASERAAETLPNLEAISNDATAIALLRSLPMAATLSDEQLLALAHTPIEGSTSRKLYHSLNDIVRRYSAASDAGKRGALELMNFAALEALRALPPQPSSPVEGGGGLRPRRPRSPAPTAGVVTSSAATGPRPLAGLSAAAAAAPAASTAATEAPSASRADLPAQLTVISNIATKDQLVQELLPHLTHFRLMPGQQLDTIMQTKMGEEDATKVYVLLCTEIRAYNQANADKGAIIARMDTILMNGLEKASSQNPTMFTPLAVRT